MKQTRTLQIRVKDKHSKLLDQLASEVNFVWNYCNELSYRAWRSRQQWLTGYDVQKYTKGASKELKLDSTCIQCISEEHARRRKQFKRSKLRWRVSKGSRRSLGWIPFKKGAAQWVNGQVRYAGFAFSVWDSYGLSDYPFRAGSFSQDARGRWYFNVAVQVEKPQTQAQTAVGIDLGLKDVATTSDGEQLKNQRIYRSHEKALADAQRAGKKGRVRAIHAKIRNTRKDAQHKFSTELVKNHAAIFVGNIKSKPLTQTKMAKSVLDAGWHQLKTMLAYKCDSAGVVFKAIDEKYTTQTCSACGSLPRSRPKGIAGLGIREWTCGECGVHHDRDINAARNILALGHQRLDGGIPFLH